MHSLRLGALRLVSSRPASFSIKKNLSSTAISSYLRLNYQLSRRTFQQRWMSDQAEKELTPGRSELPQASEQTGSEMMKSVLRAVAESPPQATQMTEPEGFERPVRKDTENTTDDDLSQVSSASLFRTPQQGIRRPWANPEPKETIYVGNLFFDVTAEDLKRQMEKYGTVLNARIIHDNRGLSKGFGYVAFDSVDAARRAIEGMNMQIFEGRRVVAQFAQMHMRSTESTQAPSKTLFIGNMAYDMTDRDLHDLFKDIRNVIDVRVSIDRRTGQPKGFAHAEFADISSAQAAFEILSSKAPYGRKLRLDYSYTNKGRSRLDEMGTRAEQFEN